MALSHPSIQYVISALRLVAADTGAEMVSSVQLELWGATLIVHWDNAMGTGLGATQDLPREAHYFFSTQEDAMGRLQWIFCYEPSRYTWAVDEGLSDLEAENEARRLVESLEESIKYLKGQSYKWVKPKGGMVGK